MPDKPSKQLEKKITEKVQKDTEEALEGDIETKVSVTKGDKKKGDPAEGLEEVFDAAGKEGLLVAMLLGITVGFLNDITDFVWWTIIPATSYVLDIISLILIIMAFTFMTSFSFVTIMGIFVVFIIEMMPVIGILPTWTLGVILLFVVNRMMSKDKDDPII